METSAPFCQLVVEYLLQTVSKPLDLPQMLKKLILKRSGARHNEETPPRDNNSQNIWD